MGNKRVRFSDIIIHEDDSVLLVNKPEGMASLDDKSEKNLNFMAKQYNPDLQLAHRLDKLTSGILLMAKTPEVYRHLAMQFQNRTVRKEYLALVNGVHHFDDFHVTLPLLVTTNKKVLISKSDGKRAETIFNVEKIYRHCTLLRCQPVTGRMHQIRVHLSASNAPIVGDSLYGGADLMLSEIKRKYVPSGRKDEERPINHGFLLHAQRLSFSHPETEEEVTYEAPLSKNFATSLKVLDKWDQ